MTEIDWLDHRIKLDVIRDQVKSSPASDPPTMADHVEIVRQLGTVGLPSSRSLLRCKPCAGALGDQGASRREWPLLREADGWSRREADIPDCDGDRSELLRDKIAAYRFVPMLQ